MRRKPSYAEAHIFRSEEVIFFHNRHKRLPTLLKECGLYHWCKRLGKYSALYPEIEKYFEQRGQTALFKTLLDFKYVSRSRGRLTKAAALLAFHKKHQRHPREDVVGESSLYAWWKKNRECLTDEEKEVLAPISMKLPKRRERLSPKERLKELKIFIDNKGRFPSQLIKGESRMYRWSQNNLHITAVEVLYRDTPRAAPHEIKNLRTYRNVKGN